MSAASRGTRDARSFILLATGVSVASGCAYLGSSILPFQIDALMSAFGQSASRAGMFGFFQIGAFALAMLALSRLDLSLPPFAAGIGGAALIAATSLLVALGPVTTAWTWGGGVLLGIGAALLGRAYVEAAAASRNPDRIYAIANGGGLAVLIAVVDLVPLADRAFGPLGVFFGTATIVTLMTPLLLTLRAAPKPAARERAAQSELSPGAVALAIIWTASSLGSSMAWAFAERVGHALALRPVLLVSLPTIGIVTSLISSLVAAGLAARLSRGAMLSVTLGALALGCLLSCSAWDARSYAAGVILYWNGSMLSYAWLLGSAAAIDRSGRVGTFCGGLDRMGYALGAPLGGFIIDHASFVALGAAAFVCCVAPLPFALPVLLRQARAGRDRQSGLTGTGVDRSHAATRVISQASGRSSS